MAQAHSSREVKDLVKIGQTLLSVDETLDGVMLFSDRGVSHGRTAERRLYSDGHRLHLHLAQSKCS